VQLINDLHDYSFFQRLAQNKQSNQARAYLGTSTSTLQRPHNAKRRRVVRRLRVGGQIIMENLKSTVQQVLENNSSRCLDNEEERAIVMSAIVEKIKQLLSEDK